MADKDVESPSSSVEEFNTGSMAFCTQIFSSEFLEKQDISIPSGDDGKERMALLKNNLWPKGSKLRVSFFGGSQTMRDKVKKYASIWSDFANITFDFSAKKNAHIIVGFVPKKGHWSWVGQESRKKTSQNEPSMNLELTDETDEVEFSSTVLHEFGHAIGCIHEHQSPMAKIAWNIPMVYRFYLTTQGWRKEETDRNMFNAYDTSEVFATAFDTKSIMIYAIPALLTTDGFTVPRNKELSAYDKAFIAAIYPQT